MTDLRRMLRRGELRAHGRRKLQAHRRIPSRPRRRRPRVGVRIDMTPMVDIAFLLLIFFMVTTVFRRPLAMEVNMPDPGAKVEVPESNVMTVYVNKDDSVRARLGTGALASVDWAGLLPSFRENLARNPNLIVLVKIHRQARYERMVDMMDALEDAEMERFSLIPMTDADLGVLGGAP
jgi:biopolymer transport protein ExbD